jgi:phage gp45-like
MHRNTLNELSGRIMHVAARVTMNKASDDPMMQEIAGDMMNSDSRKAMERIQSFGFSSVPMPRDEDEKKGGGGGGDQNIEKAKGPAAEGIALFLGGQRNHPVIIAVDDRRHRPMGMKPGENAQYDDQGQMTLLRRGGLFMLSLDDEGDGQAPGATMLRDAEGRATGQSEKKERMVSMRHVVKKKQERKKLGGGGSDGGGGGGASAGTLATEGAQSGQKEDYKHEGETVNTEIRCTKNRIEFRSGDTVVGYYDKGAETWYFKGKIVTLESTTRVETIGKTYLGLDSKNESGPKVGTEGGLAKQTWAKV